MTTTTDTMVKETITRVQVGDGAMTSDQSRKMIKEIWGEDGRDEKENKGAELSAKMEDEGAWRKDDVYKDERAGLSTKKRITKIWGEDEKDEEKV